jgi:CheY-like chemotaxis protein
VTNNTREAVILIVEDDILSFQFVKLIFKRARITNKLYNVGRGDLALDFLYKRNGFEDAPTPDLIYMDLHLPMMKGTEVLAVMQADPELSKIPTLMLTGSDEENDMEVAEEYGALGYVVKPMDQYKIFETYPYNKNIRVSLVVDTEHTE